MHGSVCSFFGLCVCSSLHNFLDLRALPPQAAVKLPLLYGIYLPLLAGNATRVVFTVKMRTFDCIWWNGCYRGVFLHFLKGFPSRLDVSMIFFRCSLHNATFLPSRLDILYVHFTMPSAYRSLVCLELCTSYFMRKEYTATCTSFS